MYKIKSIYPDTTNQRLNVVTGIISEHIAVYRQHKLEWSKDFEIFVWVSAIRSRTVCIFILCSKVIALKIVQLLTNWQKCTWMHLILTW